MKTATDLLAKKQEHKPITMVTAYDFPMAQIEDEAGVDAILVGDSVGTNVLGYESEQQVTMADMLHHAAAVARGVERAFLLADLPSHSADNPADAERNALLLLEKGIKCVKLEGWREKSGIVRHLAGKNIPVCGHIGYNPQIHGPKPKVFGTVAAEALELIKSAQALEEAGAVLMILEKIPQEVAGMITGLLRIPTIGIGSGRQCDGQVLVINDIIGTSKKVFKHARRYMVLHDAAGKALQEYVFDVEEGRFPAFEHTHHIDPREFETLKKLLKK